MSVLLDLLYREYCKARFAEMRKQLLLTDTHEVPEVNCADGAVDRAGDYVSALSLICTGAVKGVRHRTIWATGPLVLESCPRETDHVTENAAGC